MWRTLVCALLVLCATAAAIPNQKEEKAADILKAAKLKAANEKKTILLIFGASWCDSCHQMDTFLGFPEVVAIFDKYFVVANLTFGEGSEGHPDWDTPGADNLIVRYNGLQPNGEVSLPFVALLDQKGNLIANSNLPAKKPGGRAGLTFPTEPDDVKYFLAILHKAAPDMSDGEVAKLQAGLAKAAAQ